MIVHGRRARTLDTRKKTLAEELDEALESYTKMVTASPEAARKAMIESGIWLENGELSPNYQPPKPENPGSNR